MIKVIVLIAIAAVAAIVAMVAFLLKAEYLIYKANEIHKE